MNITLYGKRSSLFKRMKAIAIQTALREGIELKINETTDTNELLQLDIQSIPAYQLNKEISSKGEKDVDQFIKQMQTSILKEMDLDSVKHLIVPTDFTKTSENAAFFARELSHKIDSAIHLVHAYHISPKDLNNGVINNKAIEIKKENLNSLTDKMNSLTLSGKGLIFDSYCENGLAGDVIVKSSYDTKNAWIIMGTNNKPNRLRSMFGSISTKVALESNCPIFLVPSEYEFRSFKRIAFCLSDQYVDDNTVKEVCLLAKLYDSDLYVIHANSSDKNLDLDKAVKLFENSYSKEKIKFVHLDSSSNNAVKVINDYSELNNIDLLAIRKSKGGVFYDLFHKSFTKKISLSSKLPLFILH